MDPEEAAVKGTAEVAVAVAASTLTNIVVFTPIAFMSGIIGRFFLQFGLTVVYATIFSIVVSYTIVPMLAARLIKPQASDRDPHARGFFARIGEKWDAFYDDLSRAATGAFSTGCSNAGAAGFSLTVVDLRRLALALPLRRRRVHAAHRSEHRHRHR